MYRIERNRTQHQIKYKTYCFGTPSRSCDGGMPIRCCENHVFSRTKSNFFSPLGYSAITGNSCDSNLMDYPAELGGSTTAIRFVISSRPFTPTAVTYLVPTFQVTASWSGICAQWHTLPQHCAEIVGESPNHISCSSLCSNSRNSEPSSRTHSEAGHLQHGIFRT